MVFFLPVGLNISNQNQHLHVFFWLLITWETRSAHEVHGREIVEKPYIHHWSTLFSCLTFSVSALLAVVFKHFGSHTFPISSTAAENTFMAGKPKHSDPVLSAGKAAVWGHSFPRVSVRLQSIGNDTWAGLMLCLLGGMEANVENPLHLIVICFSSATGFTAHI